MGQPADQVLGRPTPCRDEADRRLDQADVALGVRLDRVAVEEHLAAAAERQAGGSADDRERGVLQGLERALPELDGLLEERPQGEVRRVKREAEVHSGREVLRVVADHERPEPLGHDLESQPAAWRGCRDRAC